MDANAALGLIGNTPLVRLERFAPEGQVFAKLEWCNPGGSVKDRVALGMVLDAEERGLLRAGGTIVEPTAGNTGIGLALVAAARGYRCTLVVPEGFSREKQQLMRALGASVVNTPAGEGMEGAIREAEAIAARTEGGWVPNQFTNPANPATHARTTGPEIWRQMEGRVDAVVLGGGSMGTFAGVVSYLRGENPALRAFLVQPQGSYLVGECGKHVVEGIGADGPATTGLLDERVVERVIRVSDSEAHAALHELMRTEGLLAGGSAGAAACAARAVARELGPAARVVTLFPDGAERYASQGILGPFEGWHR